MAGEEVEYESDPEEAKLSLKMRRREASDDEEGVEEGGGEEGGNRREKPARRIDSDGESDGQGAAAEYDDDVEDEDEEEYEDEEYVDEELEDEEEYEEVDDGGREAEEVVEKVEERNVKAVGTESKEESKGAENEVDNERTNNGANDGPARAGEEEKKEVEPFSVPTAGAFYMHDDRFRDNSGGRHRRTLGGRKLWESKDDRKWGHDKFEELTMQDRHYEERRRPSRGRFRGRGRGRGAEHGYTRGNRSRAYNNSSSSSSNRNNSDNNQNVDNRQSNVPKGVRGRGPRRYSSSYKSNEAPPAQNKPSGKSAEKSSRVSSARPSGPGHNGEPDAVPARKQAFASNLNIASPPFYPSSSSAKDSALPLKRDVQAGVVNRNIQPTVADESFSMAHNRGMMRGKNIVDSMGMEKLYIDDSLPAVSGKPSTTLQTGQSRPVSVNPSQQLRAPGRGTSLTPTAFQPVMSSNNQVSRVSPPTQLNSFQRNPVQNRLQSSSQTSTQQFGHRTGGPQASSPPRAAGSPNSFEPVEVESSSDTSKSKTALVAKGKGNLQSNGRGSFLYGGAQVMGTAGSMSSGHGDQNFPAFLPVMQFGGQHPGGMGVPAVGMAFPGYVAQPQLGLGNSEMTWLPVLAGAAGALGATYCSPYFAVDGSSHPRPSGQISSLATAAPSKDNSTTKVNDESTPTPRPEIGSDDFGQRQKNSRRYTEMKFDQ